MFNGIYTPIITPFDSQENIDYGCLEHNLAKWGASDLAGIVVLGSNGEAPYLSEQEKLDLIDYAVKNFNKDKKIIVGTYAESTKLSLELSEQALKKGADAVLILPPNYYKGGMNEEILYQHYTDIAYQLQAPIMLYNMPANTGLNLSSRLIARLSAHKHIVGIKDTGGNIVQMAEIIRDCPADFAIFAGNAGYLMPSLALGAKGATLALANIMPQECCQLAALMAKGDYQAAQSLQLQLLKINTLITGTYGVAGLKAALDLLGYQGGQVRRPLRPASEEACQAIKAELIKIGALV